MYRKHNLHRDKTKPNKTKTKREDDIARRRTQGRGNQGDGCVNNVSTQGMGRASTTPIQPFNHSTIQQVVCSDFGRALFVL